jgi:enterochelin esterase-like enzyme
LVIAVALMLAAGAAGAAAGPSRSGTLTTATAPSAALGEDIDYTVYLPAGYDRRENRDARYPVLYLLHGRGDTMQAWTQVKSDLDELIAAGTVPPVIAVLPDAPWSDRGGYYVDSGYTGAGPGPGRPVETAFTQDLVDHVDGTYRTAAHRGARLVGGYSMGGYGALRYALAHPSLFAHALVLSPAVYVPLPPAGSSTREFGAFGRGQELFVDEVYQELSYPALLTGLDPELPVRMYIAVGDDEWANPDPAEATHDLDYEAATLYNRVRRSDAVAADLRVVDGGHDWGVWRPAFRDGLAHLGTTLSAAAPVGLPAPLLGTPGEDLAGGVAAHPDGTVTVGYAAAGSAGGLDAVVTRLGPDRAALWTRQLGTPANDRPYGVVPAPDGGVITAGYTRGDLDGQHPDSPADDGFVARLDGDGEPAWLVQLGDPARPDRFYGLAAAPDGGAYVAGYSSGEFAGPSNGDKDAVVARIAPDGEVAWTRQLGGAGEDKALAVAADAAGVYVAGVTSAGMPGTAHQGGTDGWLAGLDPDTGEPQWMVAAGGPGSDLLGGVAVGAGGGPVATGTLDGDLLTVAYSAEGRRGWRTVTEAAGYDAGADLVALPDGGVLVVGFSDSAFGVPAGGFDVLTVRLDARGRQQAAGQFGTAQYDAADIWWEENVYAAAAGDRVLVSGLTYGTPAGGTAHGNGDVFLVDVDPGTGLP